MEDPGAAEPDRQPDAFRTSLVAVVLGIILALVVSRLFTLVGWGGEQASQAAGAASGTGPLLIDGLRQRREQRVRRGSGDPALGTRTARRPWMRPSAVLVAAGYGFVLAVIDTAVPLLLGWLNRRMIAATDGKLEQKNTSFLWLVGVIEWPLMIVAVIGLAAWATHYLLPRPKRWILFGLGVYAVLKVGLLATADTNDTGFPAWVWVLAIVLFLVPLLFAISLVGVWWGRRTDAVARATGIFRRLSPDDQIAALALLEESAPPRSSRRRRPNGDATARRH